MKKVYTDEFISWVSQAKQILEANEIACFLKNEYLSVAGGEVPFFENWPELWIHDDADYEQAQTLIQPLRDIRQSKDNEASNEPDWTCDQCGETNEANFSLCWSCGTTVSEA
ncbi:DUF2007 domain-containing protein [Marinicella sp. S1101]|uniref:putative signal transducing protein n=1 Tax=Marinicella marina TaxID=2996016 RepID=UPI002260E271|nr:DUF2007 domain-containing protein [Marinicella marina]MCX7553137.1 DUF2007 domain-containing protein [Marinicella marina]MDJ1138869.1 DUF2007 domain-containing protein [Marinicella marina]